MTNSKLFTVQNSILDKMSPPPLKNVYFFKGCLNSVVAIEKVAYRVILEAVFFCWYETVGYAFPLWIVGRIITSRPGNVTSPGRRTALCCRTPRKTHNSFTPTSGGPHLSSCKSSSHDKMGD